jgi:hypothetical protein
VSAIMAAPSIAPRVCRETSWDTAKLTTHLTTREIGLARAFQNERWAALQTTDIGSVKAYSIRSRRQIPAHRSSPTLSGSCNAPDGTRLGPL